MGLFGKIVSLGMDVVTTPIAAVKALVTLDGAVTDEQSPIAEKAKQIEDDWNEIKKELKK